MQQVPQFINTEDKIAGPFTWRQLLWLGGLTVLLVLLWQFLDKSAFYVFGIPLTIVVAAFVFYRPQGLPLISFVQYALVFFFTPRIYLWQREVQMEKHNKKKVTTAQQAIPIVKKDLSSSDIVSLTQTLDSHGEESDERLQQLIKKNISASQKKKSKLLSRS